MSSFSKSTVRGVETAEVGPLYLIARRYSYALAFRSMPGSMKDVVVGSSKEAKRLVVEAARKKLAEWGSELDRLAEEVK